MGNGVVDFNGDNCPFIKNSNNLKDGVNCEYGFLESIGNVKK